MEMNALRTITVVGKTEGVDQATASLRRLAESEDGVAVASDRTAGSTLSVERSLYNLQMRLDPVFRQTQVLAAAERELNLARQQGLISLERQTALLALQEEKFKTGEAGIMGMVKSMKMLLETMGIFLAFEFASKLHEMIAALVEGSAKIVDVAQAIGLTTKELQEFQFVSNQFHISAETTNTALERFAKNMGIASTGAGELAKILKANHVEISGNVRQDFLRYADLVKNAGDEEQRMTLITTALGKGAAELAPIFEHGADGMQRAFDQADRMGAIISDEKLQQLAALDRQWQAFGKTLEVNVKTAVINIILAFDGLQKRLEELMGPFQKLMDAATFINNTLGGGISNSEASKVQQAIKNALGNGGIPGSADPSAGQMLDPMALARAKATAQLKIQLGSPTDGKTKEGGSIWDWSTTKPTTTVIPPGGGGGSNPFETALKSLEKQKIALESQIATFGKASGAVAEYTKRQELMLAAQEAGIKMTPEVTKQIDEAAIAYGKLTSQVQHLNDVQQASQFLSQQMFNILEGLLNHTTNLTDAFKNLALAIGQALLQAGLMGTGPLAGIMGLGGGQGGILGTVAKAALGAFGVAHEGTMVGMSATPMRFANPQMFVNAPRYEVGGFAGMRPGEVPIIAHFGEEILRRDDPRHRMNGGVNDRSIVVGGATINVMGDASENTIALIRSALREHENKLTGKLASLVQKSIAGNNKLQVRYSETHS